MPPENRFAVRYFIFPTISPLLFYSYVQLCSNTFNSLFIAFNYNEVKYLVSKNADKTCKNNRMVNMKNWRGGYSSQFLSLLFFLHFISLIESLLAKACLFVLFLLSALVEYTHSLQLMGWIIPVFQVLQAIAFCENFILPRMQSGRHFLKTYTNWQLGLTILGVFSSLNDSIIDTTVHL